MKLYLYEGLNTQDRASVLLWESAGRKLVEAQLTADQITQLFQQIQTAKGNRTLVGKGIDAGSAVMKAYADLKSKVANSGPIQNMDALYDQAAEKLKQATGGDQGAMSYVQKYRDFAKKHPIAQSFIYGALIAAAGISGVGAGGAAALGLFKMVDKLLQGEKFSSAAYSGAKTGAMAYAAGQIGKAVRGDQQVPAGTDQLAAKWAGNRKELAQDLLKYYSPENFNYVSDGMNINIIDKATGQLTKMVTVAGDSDLGPINPGTFVNKILSGEFGKPISAAAADTARAARDAAFNAANPNFESRDLSHKQVLALFERVARLNSRMLSEGRLEEGIWDDIKSGAGKGLQGIKNLAGKAVGAVAQGAAKVGRSMTANVSSDALTKAWQAAGSPTDSAEIEKLLQAQGVNPEVVKTVFQANSIPLSVAAAASTGSAGVDANEPMPDVMSTNRAETPAAAVPSTASAGPGAQVAQQQAQQAPQQTIQQPASAEPTAGSAVQGAAASIAANKIKVDSTEKMVKMVPIIARLTPEQKKQLLAQIDQRLASMSAAIAQQPTPPAPPPPAPPPPVATAPTQQAQPQDAEAQQKARDDAINNAVNAEPDLKVSPAPKAGTPTPAEQAKLQAKLKAADQAQNKTKPAPKELAESYKEFKYLVDGIKARI
jgi:hypothetical protein